MKNTLILHGWGWNSEWNWNPWLRDEVQYKADETYVPNLPNTDNPKLKEQLDYIDIYSSDFKDGWNIVWHSLWCQLAMHFILENNISNLNLVLVAPTYPNIINEIWEEVFWDCLENIREYYDSKINFKKFNKLNSKITIFISDNDPYVNMDSAKKFYSNFDNVKFIEFKNKGHFNAWSETFELEEILEYID